MPNTIEKLIELIHDSDYSLDSVRLAEHLISNGVTVADNLSPTEPLTNCQKWIPVKERLPDSGIEVLAMLQVNKSDGHDAHNVATAVRIPSGRWLVADYIDGVIAETAGSDCENCCYWITHWMPLPEPPKEE